MAVADGCEGFGFWRVPDGYEMYWLVQGVRREGSKPLPGYVRRFVKVLGQRSHGRLGFGQLVGRFLRRFGSVMERGSLDWPVGPEYVVAVSYRAEWRRGHVSELEIAVGESVMLSASGIARSELDLAWHGPLRD